MSYAMLVSTLPSQWMMLGSGTTVAIFVNTASDIQAKKFHNNLSKSCLHQDTKMVQKDAPCDSLQSALKLVY